MSGSAAVVPEHVPLRYSRGADGKIVQSAGGDELLLNPENFPVWRKAAPTRAARIPRRFTVETTEGVMTCEDGWLAVDSEGNPYPIADDVFKASYESVSATAAEGRRRALPAVGPRDGEAFRDSAQLALLTFLEEYDCDLGRERRGEECRWPSHDQGARALLDHLRERGFELTEVAEPSPNADNDCGAQG